MDVCMRLLVLGLAAVALAMESTARVVRDGVEYSPSSSPFGRRAIHLRTGTISIDDPTYRRRRRALDDGETIAGIHILHLGEGGSGIRGLKQRVEAALGVELEAYVPHDSFIVYLGQEQAALARTLERRGTIAWSMPLEAERKALISSGARPPYHVTIMSSSVGHAESVAAKIPGAEAVSRSKIVVSKVDGDEDGSRVLEMLVSNERVVCVEEKPRYNLLNKWSAGTVQSGMECPPCTEEDGCSECGRGGGMTPVWEMGLKGDGEIMGCGDTGIDVDSCFFWDSQCTLPGVGVPYAPDNQTSKRKIVSYNAYGDGTDYNKGHGTHVVGSMVGSVKGTQGDGESVGEFSGMAPEAKLVFFDLLAGPGGDGLDVPDALEEDYFNWAYQHGARVHSNSWGGSSGEYTSNCAEIDSFVFNNPDCLVLFAAGNSGPEEGSVGAPATCKNCVAVGASQNDERGKVLGGGALKAFVEAGGGSWAGGWEASGATFGPEIKEGGFDGTLNWPASWGGVEMCEEPADGFGGYVAVARRGNCTFMEKCANAEMGGASFLVVVNNKEGAPINMGGSVGPGERECTISSVMVSMEDGASLKEMVERAEGGVLRFRAAPSKNDPNFGIGNLALFSSQGPTADGRLKPDLVAPGASIWSAASDGKPYSYQCGEDIEKDDRGVTRMSGTSMATPIAAGAAALIRQYFRTGRLGESQNAGWMFTSAANAGFIPSSALLRSVLINGAQPLTGKVGSKGEVLRPPPSHVQGYGRVQVTTSILVPSNGKWPGSKMKLAVLDAFSQPNTSTTAPARVAHGQMRQHCVTVSNDSLPLKATIAWTDPPAIPLSEFALVNDLNLVVWAQYPASGAVAERNVLLYGNHLLNSTDDCSGGGCGMMDEINNNEQVFLERPPFGPGTKIRIIVIGQHVVMGSGRDANHPNEQEYALAITGAGLQTLDDAGCAIECVSECSGHGVCSPLEGGSGDMFCVCDAGWIGVDCSMPKLCPMECSGHGQCDVESAECDCEQGWEGPGCSHFHCASGAVNIVYPLEDGGTVITNSDWGSYSDESACLFEVRNRKAIEGVELNITHLEVESVSYFEPLEPGCDGDEDCWWYCAYDALYVIQGDFEEAMSGQVTSNAEGENCHSWASGHQGHVATLCGDLYALTGGSPITFRSASGPLSLVLCTDEVVHFSGFEAHAVSMECPGQCSGRGVCLNGVCECRPGWAGNQCTERVFACVADPFMANHTHSEDALFRGINSSSSLPSCPEHYRCTPLELESSQGICTCAPGYSGVDCGDPHCDGSVELGFPNGYLRSHALHTETIAVGTSGSGGNESNGTTQETQVVRVSLPYQPHSNCRWTIHADIEDSKILRVNVTALDIESGYDVLAITSTSRPFAGRGRNGPSDSRRSRGTDGQDGRDSLDDQLVANLTGSFPGSSALPAGTGWVSFDIFDYETPVHIQFTSDYAKEGNGFALEWSVMPKNATLKRAFALLPLLVPNGTWPDVNKTLALQTAVSGVAGVLPTHCELRYPGGLSAWSIAGAGQGEGEVWYQGVVEVRVYFDKSSHEVESATRAARMLGQKELVEEGLSRAGLSNVTVAGPVGLSIDGSDLDLAPSTEDLIGSIQYAVEHASGRDAGLFFGGIATALALILGGVGCTRLWRSNKRRSRYHFRMGDDSNDQDDFDFPSSKGGTRMQAMTSNADWASPENSIAGEIGDASPWPASASEGEARGGGGKEEGKSSPSLANAPGGGLVGTKTSSTNPFAEDADFGPASV